MSVLPPVHRHQSSLKGIIDFYAEPPLGADQRANAKRRFYHISDHFEAANVNKPGHYSRPRLVRLTYDYVLSDESRDNFLRAFFRAMALSIDGPEDVDFDELRSSFYGFADHLLDNFFLPLKASTRKTPQPSPAYHSAIQTVQTVQTAGQQGFAGTPDRLSALRGACLTRDCHRCVISRKFSIEEAENRMKRDGDDARDDDGSLLVEDSNFDVLEVAHILPHSLIKADKSPELSSSRQAALAVLNMFDNGVVHLIEGTDIDRPRNAITLTHMLHWLFGEFRVYFEPTPDGQQHAYCVNSFYPRALLRDPTFPITRSLYVTDTRIIDPPSPRLLAVHRAIAHILHLSAAGDYIDKLLRDMDGKDVRADGSTELDRLVKLRLGGWLEGSVSS